MKETKVQDSTPVVESIKKKSHLPRNKKMFWMFYVLCVVFLALGGALLPVWGETDVPWKNLGDKFFSLILSFVIIVYILGYLIRQIIRESKVAIKVLTVFEAGFFFAVALGSFMQYFDSASIGGPSTIVGIAFWSRGFVYIVKAYLCKHEEGDKYPLWTLIFSIGLVSFGSVMIANKVFTTEHVVWVVAITLFVVSAIMLFLGIVSKPKVDKVALALKKEQKKLKKQEKELAKKEKQISKTKKKTDKLETKAEALLPAPVEQQENQSSAENE